MCTCVCVGVIVGVDEREREFVGKERQTELDGETDEEGCFRGRERRVGEL